MSEHPQEKKQASVPQKRRGFTVAASPFNGIKLDLALILILGVVAFLVQERVFSDNSAGGLALLIAYGLWSAIWIVFRVNRVRARLARRGPDGGGGYGEKD